MQLALPRQTWFRPRPTPADYLPRYMHTTRRLSQSCTPSDSATSQVTVEPSRACDSNPEVLTAIEPLDVPPLFPIKLSAYRLINATIITALATAKVVLSLKGYGVLPNVLDWVVAVPVMGV